MIWKCRDRELNIGKGARVMGILNVTPDSFSDGGSYGTVDGAVARGLEMRAQGADIIDIGGESTRPGSSEVPIPEEINRVVPVIQALRRQSDVFISVDTRKSEVAREAMEAGADIVNDVSACRHDDLMVDVCRTYQAGIVLMHMRGEPGTMQDSPHYDDVVVEVTDYLATRAESLEEKGVSANHIVLDPGIGFGKTLEHNVALLRGLPEIEKLGYPILVGLSRKRFLGELTGLEVADRMVPGVAAMTMSVINGAHIVRVHDVADTVNALKVVDALATEAVT